MSKPKKSDQKKSESHKETIARIREENRAHFRNLDKKSPIYSSSKKYNCHWCYEECLIPKENIGKDVVCPHCSKIFIVSEPIDYGWNELTSIINADASVLAIKRRQLVYLGSYGEEKVEDWLKEVEYYIKLKNLGKFAVSGHSKREIINLVDITASSKQVPNVSPTRDPLEFERQCADTLQRFGWSTQLTAKTGDQGIDIIAQKKGIKIVVQCKLYSNPVGNGAVQEIAAGRSFEQADHAIVVTTAGFTKSAITLAKNTQVLLLDFAELGELDSKLLI